MPAAGLPVASITISISPLPMAASGSSKMQVVPCSSASAMDRAADRSAPQPTRARESCARCGARSTTATTWMPAVRRLGKEHRAELAGPDQCDAQRPSLGGAPGKQSVPVHGALVSL